MGFAKPIEQYLFGNLLTKMHVFMYLKDIIRGTSNYAKQENQRRSAGRESQRREKIGAVHPSASESGQS